MTLANATVRSLAGSDCLVVVLIKYWQTRCVPAPLYRSLVAHSEAVMTGVMLSDLGTRFRFSLPDLWRVKEKEPGARIQESGGTGTDTHADASSDPFKSNQ
jgi:hypothetical protein